MVLDSLVAENEILKRSVKLREDKSAGTDGMFSRFLNAISAVTAAPVTMLFNQSLLEGSVPLTDWKLASVSPIFKRSRTLGENYV